MVETNGGEFLDAYERPMLIVEDDPEVKGSEDR